MIKKKRRKKKPQKKKEKAKKKKATPLPPHLTPTISLYSPASHLHLGQAFRGLPPLLGAVLQELMGLTHSVGAVGQLFPSGAAPSWLLPQPFLLWFFFFLPFFLSPPPPPFWTGREHCGARPGARKMPKSTKVPFECRRSFLPRPTAPSARGEQRREALLFLSRGIRNSSYFHTSPPLPFLNYHKGPPAV